jgi:hypothetical protein
VVCLKLSPEESAGYSHPVTYLTTCHTIDCYPFSITKITGSDSNFRKISGRKTHFVNFYFNQDNNLVYKKVLSSKSLPALPGFDLSHSFFRLAMELANSFSEDWVQAVRR